MNNNDIYDILSRVRDVVFVAISNSLVNLVLFGYVFSKLWYWFIVKNLNLPYINTINSIGIILLIRLFFIPENELDNDWDKIKNKIHYCLYALVLGFILSR